MWYGISLHGRWNGWIDDDYDDDDYGDDDALVLRCVLECLCECDR